MNVRTRYFITRSRKVKVKESEDRRRRLLLGRDEFELGRGRVEEWPEFVHVLVTVVVECNERRDVQRCDLLLGTHRFRSQLRLRVVVRVRPRPGGRGEVVVA